MLKTGDKVRFRVYDSLFKKWIHATGVIKSHWIGKLWMITAKNQPMLQLNFEQRVHEDNING